MAGPADSIGDSPKEDRGKTSLPFIGGFPIQHLLSGRLPFKRAVMAAASVSQQEAIQNGWHIQTHPYMDPITLRCPSLQVDIHPLQGGRVGRFLALDACRPMAILALASESAEQTVKPQAWGAFPLIPFSNRIRDACFELGGRRHYLLPHSAARPHALHGVCRNLSWRVLEESSATAHLSVAYDGPEWPWPFRAEQRFALDGCTLSIALSLANLGKSLMPGGLGLHPFINLTPESRLIFIADIEWECDDNRFPLKMHPKRKYVDLSRSVWQEGAYYGHFSGWSGHAEVRHPMGILTIRTSPALRHLVCYAPAGAEHLCFEPVSHITNAHNLPEAFETDTGLRMLAPGESMSGEIRMTWNSDMRGAALTVVVDR